MFYQALKAITTKSLAIFGLFFIVAAFAVSTSAQVTERMDFTIPFEFTVGNERLPAGEYTVKRTSLTNMAFTIQNKKENAAVIAGSRNTLPGSPKQAQARLVFNVHNGQYFLSQIRPGGFDRGSELHQSRAEREVMKASAQSGEQVTLVAAR